MYTIRLILRIVVIPVFINLIFKMDNSFAKTGGKPQNLTQDSNKGNLFDSDESTEIKYGNDTIGSGKDGSEDPLRDLIHFDEEIPSKNYRRFLHGRRDERGYGHGPGVSTFAFASAGGGWAGAGTGFGGEKGWGPPKGNRGTKHYSPSLNKYGGGGPLAFVPGKGGGGRQFAPNAGNSGNPGNAGSAGASASAGAGNREVIVPETTVHIVTCDVRDKCHSFVHCASYPFNYLRAQDRCCLMQKLQGRKGICCDARYPENDNGNSAGKPFKSYATDKVRIPDISESSLADAAKKGYEYKEKYNQIEDRLHELNIVVQRGTPEYGHLQFFQTTPAAIRTARDSFLVVKAGNYIQDKYFLSSSEAGIGLQGFDFGGTVFEKLCTPSPRCNLESKYRTYDGTCNNPRSPKLGQSSTPLIRLLPPDYADGLWTPRVRRDGTPLPSPRFITRSLVPDIDQPDLRYSHLLMQFGQFIDHDFSHVPIFRFEDNSGIQCCSGRDEHQSYLTHPACFPIDIPPNDPYIQGDCMNFVRSMIAPRIDCTFGHADQMNQLTHWLDASQIYGNTQEQGEALREFSGGLLKVSRGSHGRQDLLPEDSNDEDQDCSTGPGRGLHCFLAGDRRVNEQIGLVSIHTIFLREHNRIAVELGHLNPHWEDELLFQETRRIVIAEYQHIIYNEWLPIIIGRSYMETFGILPLYNGYYTGYDSGVDGSVSNAFSTAAFRMGHTLVQGQFDLESGSGNTVGRLVLRDFFNNPHLLRQPGVVDLLNKGFLTQPIQRFDNFVTTELRDHLFQTSGQAGMDLIALNIQRGRDHGLPSYNEYRDLCRIGKGRDFSDLAPTIHPRKIAGLQQIYSNVDDIDLFIGGIHETPLPGAVVGPTFACIIGDQFVRAKKGDRYFHDRDGQAHSFTEEQLHTIRTASMARILCDNSDEIRSIQPLAFYLPNNGFNPMIPCGSSSIPHLDLGLWRE